MEPCTLGFIDEKADKLKDESLSAADSKIFGKPHWHCIHTAPKDSLDCDICGRKLHFICQLYSPIDYLNRSLYVFSCRSDACSIMSRGWKVVRNQIVNSHTAENADTVRSIPNLVDLKPKASFDWDDEDDDLSSLNKLVTNRENGVQLSEQLVPAPVPKTIFHKPVQLSQPVDICEVSYPMWTMADNSEDGGERIPSKVLNNFPRYGTGGDGGGRSTNNKASTSSSRALVQDEQESLSEDEEEEEEEEDGHDIDSNRILQMLNSYGEESENAQIVSELKQQLLTSVSNRNANTSRDREGVSTVKPFGRVYMHPTASVQMGLNNSSSRHATGSSSNKQLSQYRQKVEQFFQKVVSYNPKQILRYQYSSNALEPAQPLWCSVLYKGMSASTNNSSSCTAASSVDELVTTCPHCKVKRVFEFQLMPALLSYYSKTKVVNSTVQDKNDIDFGVVAIYVCPNSCNESIFEQAIVQAPADMIVD